MGLWIERWHPWIAALLGGLTWYFLSWPFPSDGKEFLASAISLGAIMTGFIATAQAILAALPSDSAMGRIRSSGYIKELVAYLAESLYGCLGFSVCSLGGFFLLSPGGVLSRAYSGIFVGLAIFSMLAFRRVSSVLFKILHFQPPKED